MFCTHVRIPYPELLSAIAESVYLLPMVKMSSYARNWLRHILPVSWSTCLRVIVQLDAGYGIERCQSQNQSLDCQLVRSFLASPLSRNTDLGNNE